MATNQKQNAQNEPGLLEKLLGFFAARDPLQKAASTGAPTPPKVTPAQDTSALEAAIAETMRRKKAREDAEAAKKILSVPKNRVR